MSAPFGLKLYQRQSLDALRDYLAEAAATGDANLAFYRLRHGLEKGPAGEPVPSLANVLRLRRPMVIVDEAHNARTALSFDVLARLVRRSSWNSPQPRSRQTRRTRRKA